MPATNGDGRLASDRDLVERIAAAAQGTERTVAVAESLTAGRSLGEAASNPDHRVPPGHDSDPH